MGLDWVPIGKPLPGKEERFKELYQLIPQAESDQEREPLLDEWFGISTSYYETIGAPQVGRDPKADEWLAEYWRTQNETADEKPLPFDQFHELYMGYYVTDLAERQEGLSAYIGGSYDEAAFRAKFLEDCEGYLAEELLLEAWRPHLADEALDYGKRLMAETEKLAKKHGLTHLAESFLPPTETESDPVANAVHIGYSAAKWLIFYGSNGHGFDADF